MVDKKRLKICRITAIGLVLLLLSILFNVLATTEIDVEDLYGTYKANHSKGEDIIIVRPNGSYEHRYENKTGQMVIQKGNWNYNQKYGGYISFYNFEFEDWVYKEISLGTVGFPTERSVLGTIRFFIDDGEYFYKEKGWEAGSGSTP